MTVNEIVDKVVNYLLALPEETEISTGEVLGKILGIDRLEDAVLDDGTKLGAGELFSIVGKVDTKAKKKGLILDSLNMMIWLSDCRTIFRMLLQKDNCVRRK